MTRLPFLGFLLLLLVFQVSAQPKMIRSAFNPTKTGDAEDTPVRHPANEKPDTTHYLPITTVKNDFTVNSGNELFGSVQEELDIVNGPDGAFLCAWVDYRSWNATINAQLFDGNGGRVGSRIVVSDRPDNTFTIPRVTFNPQSNEYIIVWMAEHKILLQRLSAAGDKIGMNAVVYDIWDASRISAAVDTSGNIYVTWIFPNRGDALPSPYVRLLSKNGTPLTQPWTLTATDTGFSIAEDREEKSIATDGKGHCLVVWNRTSKSTQRSQIVLQSVNSSGNLYPHPIVVNDTAAAGENIYPTIAGTRDGHFFILWRSDNTLLGRIYHPDSGFVTRPFPIAPATVMWYPYVVSSDDAGRFFVAWETDGVFGQVFTAQGESVAPPVALPIPTVTGITNLSLNRLLLGYSVFEHSQLDVMIRAFDRSFLPMGNAQMAADDNNSAVQSHPIVRYNRFGQALAVWTDGRNGYEDLYGQLFDAAGNPVSSNFQINDMSSRVNYSPSIAADPDGNFTVAFAAGDYNTTNVRLQKVFSNGMPGGGNIDAAGSFWINYHTLSTSIQTDSVRNARIFWWAGRNRPLYSSRFDAALTVSGAVQPIFNAIASSPMNILAVSANHRFDILVLWTDILGDYYPYKTPSGGILKAIVIDEKGKIIRDTMTIGVVPDTKVFDRAACRIDDEGNMLFVWTDVLIGPGDVTLHTRRVYPAEDAARTDSSLTYYTSSGAQIAKFEKKQALIAWDTYPRLRALLIDDASMQTSPIDLQTAPTDDKYVTNYSTFSTDCHDNLLFTAFQKANGERSLDILAKVQFFGRIGSDSQEIAENAAAVYPNPVRESATFRYAFTKSTEVRIALYNILGQKIADIVQGMKPAGQYTVQFPTRNLPAGVYFFVVNGLKTSTTKFIVVK